MTGIGAQSSYLRRSLLRAFASTYFRRRVRTSDGVFEAYLSPGSSLKVLRLQGVHIDPVHQRFIRDWISADSVVWDIGTNLGLFAFPAALKAMSGQVYGFEPDVELAANFVRSVRLPQNKGLNISLFAVAVSNVDSTARFQISKFSRAMNKLEDVGKWNEQQIVVDETRNVVTMRIDTLLHTLTPPTAIKIDVEGAEIEVLEGGEATISEYRPVILIEGPSELSDKMGAFFRAHNYVLFNGAAEDPTPLQETVWDTVAVPREKASSRT